MAFLQVESLNVFHDEIQALWDVSFSVEQGSITALLGSNGAGKTTLLYAIAGLLRQKTGKITFCGEDISALPAYQRVERGICLVPEGRRLFPHLSVQENLELGGYSKRAKRYRHQIMSLVFEFFPRLKDYRNRIAGTLSGGEQQMLAIARGLMTKPTLLMLDEPSLGLAPLMVRKLFEIIKQINLAGVTVLLVEQNVHYTLEICNKAFVLETGRLVAGGDKDVLTGQAIRAAYLGI